MIYSTLKTFHLLSIIVWLGGLTFLLCFLRQAVVQFDPPLRLRLMHDVLGRFFQTLLVISFVTLTTGLWMLGRVARQVVQSGGSFQMPLAWTLMTVFGVIMVAMVIYIRFALYRTFGRHVAASEWSAAGTSLSQIHTWMSIKLGLGGTVVLATLMLGRA